jgi:hypothetical protein
LKLALYLLKFSLATPCALCRVQQRTQRCTRYA